MIFHANDNVQIVSLPKTEGTHGKDMSVVSMMKSHIPSLLSISYRDIFVTPNNTVALSSVSKKERIYFISCGEVLFRFTNIETADKYFNFLLDVQRGKTNELTNISEECPELFL